MMQGMERRGFLLALCAMPAAALVPGLAKAMAAAPVKRALALPEDWTVVHLKNVYRVTIKFDTSRPSVPTVWQP